MTAPSDKPASAGSGHAAVRMLGGYRLLEPLGSGAMADVFLAEQVSLGRMVAVKVLRPDARGGLPERIVERFLQEARAAASLVHGNIVQIHEIGCIGGVHFIAEEYVAGPNLKRWLSERGVLSPSQVLSVLEQVAAALDRASRRQIVHRDIKPENLLVAPTGEVKVADFGLARVSHEGGLDLTQEGTTLGTPLYMSPEQVEGRTLDSRSDLYSLGATCYHLLAGRPPFEGETSMAVALAHVRQRPQPLAGIRPELPAGLTGIVERLLAKSPDDRHASPAELLAEVQRVTTTLEGDAARSASLVWDASADGPIPRPLAAASPTQRLTSSTTREPAEEVREATGRLAAATRERAAARAASRRFWLATAAAGSVAFLAGIVLGRTVAGRRQGRLKRPGRAGR